MRINNIFFINNILELAVPIGISSMLGVLAILINTAILGKTGQYNLYLLALFLPVNYFQIAIFEAFRAPALALSSLHRQSQDQEIFKNKIISLLIIASICILAGALLFEFTQNSLVKIFNIPSIMTQEFIIFTRDMLLTGIFICANYILNSLLYGRGRPRVAMYLSIATVVINCGLTYLLGVYYKLGVHGLVYATGFSNIVMTGITIFILNKLNIVNLKSWYKLPRSKYYLAVIIIITKIGSPVWFSYLVLFAGLVLFNKILSYFGTSIVAGFGVAYRIQTLVVLPAISIGMAVAILINRFISTGAAVQAQKVLRAGIILSAAFYFFVSPLLYFFRINIIEFITQDYVTVSAAGSYLKYVALSYIGLGPLLVFLIILDQTGSGVKSLGYSIASFATEFIVGGSWALHKNNIHFFYVVIAAVNLSSLLLVIFECFFNKKYLNNLSKVMP